jgi:hypothetical protein
VPSTFRGLVPTPALDHIANEGLRFNNFHATALCSPTRPAGNTFAQPMVQFGGDDKSGGAAAAATAMRPHQTGPAEPKPSI